MEEEKKSAEKNKLQKQAPLDASMCKSFSHTCKKMSSTNKNNGPLIDSLKDGESTRIKSPLKDKYNL